MAKRNNKKQNNAITLKNGLFGNPAFIGTLREVANSKMHAVAASRINTLIKLMKTKSEDYQEIKIKFCKELGEETKDKKGYSFPDEKNREEFLKEMDDLDNLDIKIDIEKIKFPDSIDITPIQSGLIEDLFIFEEPPNELKH